MEGLRKIKVIKRSVDGVTYYYETTKRILFDPVTQEFYGIISEDYKTISPIPCDIVTFLNKIGYSVRKA